MPIFRHYGDGQLEGPNVIIGCPRPFRLVFYDKRDAWKPSVADINTNKYDYVKLHRLSASFDIGLPLPNCMHFCFDSSLILPAIPEFFPIEKAIEKFNQILGELLLGGLYFEALSIHDIDIGILYNTGYARSLGLAKSYQGVLRNVLKSKIASPFFAIELLNPEVVFYRDLVSQRGIGLDILKKITNLSSSYLLLGTSSMLNRDWPSAVVNVWICIEQLLSFLWETHIIRGEKQPEPQIQGRKDFLSDDRTWTSSTKMELFFQNNLIDNIIYHDLNQARKSRNALIHDGKIPLQEDALAAFKGFYLLLSRNVEEHKDHIISVFESLQKKAISKEKEENTIPISELETKGMWMGPIPPIPGEKAWGDKGFENIYEMASN